MSGLTRSAPGDAAVTQAVERSAFVENPEFTEILDCVLVVVRADDLRVLRSALSEALAALRDVREERDRLEDEVEKLRDLESGKEVTPAHKWALDRIAALELSRSTLDAGISRFVLRFQRGFDEIEILHDARRKAALP